MAGNSVRCQVNTCTHWLQSGRCGATDIDILSADGGLPGNPSGTACRTFHRKRGLANYLGSLENVNWWGVIGMAGDKWTSPAITCQVSNCRHWVPGDLCQADEVTVTGGGAATSGETDCQTFATLG